MSAAIGFHRPASRPRGPECAEISNTKKSSLRVLGRSSAGARAVKDFETGTGVAGKMRAPI